MNTSPCECGGSSTCGCCANDDGVWGSSLWTVTADALFLERRDPAAVVWAFNTANPTQNFDAADFDFGFHTGFDVSVARRVGCDNAIEIRYFGIDDWNATSLTTTTPGDLLRVNAAVPVFTFSGDAISTAYASQLHNAEINGRRQLNDWLSLLAGFRYAELDEPASVTSSTRRFHSTRELYAKSSVWVSIGRSGNALEPMRSVQNGCRWQSRHLRIYAAQDTSLSTGLVTLPANGRDDHTAFIGEVGITGTYQLTGHLARRGGYGLRGSTASHWRVPVVCQRLRERRGLERQR